MTYLVRLLLSWSVRRFLVFILLVIAIIAAAKLKEAYDRLPHLAVEIESLERNQRLLAEEVASQRERAVALLEEMPNTGEAALRIRLAGVRNSIRQAERDRSSALGVALKAARGEGAALARDAAAGFKLDLLRREEALIVARLQAIGRAGEMRSVIQRLAILDRQIAALERRITAIEREHPVVSRLEEVPLVRSLEGPWRELRTTRQELAERRAERVRLGRFHGSLRGAFLRAKEGEARAQSAIRTTEASTNALTAAIEERRRDLSDHWVNRLWGSVRPVIGWAFWLLLVITLVPLAVKAFWYFIVAPVAARLKPITLSAEDCGTVVWAEHRRDLSTRGSGSDVSWRLRLRPGEEALLRPDYLQTSPGHATARSQLLLSPDLILGSLATGLFGLTRISPTRDTSITISATKDLVDEIGVIEVSEGSSLVFRPRNLVGVVRPIAGRLRIERIWTASRLSSWLALRLRHIVFHGPVALVVKGARGVALEPAEGGRRVAGAATLGWSAGLRHSIARSETFLAFLTGKQSLFIDCFEGETGMVVYEELPRAADRAGLLGRGLQGLGDAALKTVGL